MERAYTNKVANHGNTEKEELRADGKDWARLLARGSLCPGPGRRREAEKTGIPERQAIPKDRSQKRYGNAELQSVPKKGRLGLASQASSSLASSLFIGCH